MNIRSPLNFLDTAMLSFEDRFVVCTIPRRVCDFQSMVDGTASDGFYTERQIGKTKWVKFGLNIFFK